MGKLVPAGTFTWVGSDGWANQLGRMEHLGDMLLGAIHVSTLTALAPDYEQHFQRLKLVSNPPKGGRGISDVSPLSGISGLSV